MPATQPPSDSGLCLTVTTLSPRQTVETETHSVTDSLSESGTLSEAIRDSVTQTVSRRVNVKVTFTLSATRNSESLDLDCHFRNSSNLPDWSSYLT